MSRRREGENGQNGMPMSYGINTRSLSKTRMNTQATHSWEGNPYEHLRSITIRFVSQHCNNMAFIRMTTKGCCRWPRWGILRIKSYATVYDISSCRYTLPVMPDKDTVRSPEPNGVLSVYPRSRISLYRIPYHAVRVKSAYSNYNRTIW